MFSWGVNVAHKTGRGGQKGCVVLLIILFQGTIAENHKKTN